MCGRQVRTSGDLLEVVDYSACDWLEAKSPLQPLLKVEPQVPESTSNTVFVLSFSQHETYLRLRVKNIERQKKRPYQGFSHKRRCVYIFLSFPMSLLASLLQYTNRDIRATFRPHSLGLFFKTQKIFRTSLHIVMTHITKHKRVNSNR